jgi:hypothetical protein
MVAAPLMNEADCLAHELRRTGSANYLDLTRSAYRESGLVRRPKGEVGGDKLTAGKQTPVRNGQPLPTTHRYPVSWTWSPSSD